MDYLTYLAWLALCGVAWAAGKFVAHCCDKALECLDIQDLLL